MLGFTEPTICTTESNGMPIALAYSGKVIHALQKHANAVRTTIPTSNETMTAFLVLCIFLYTNQVGNTNNATPKRFASSPT